MKTYSYTIPNLKFLEHLHAYIHNITELPTDFSLYNEESLDIIYENELSDGNLIILNNAINSYIPPQELIVNTNSENINLFNSSINTTVYSLLGVYVYSSNIVNFLNSVSFVCNVSNGGIFKLRLYNSVDKTVIVESESLNNTTSQLITLNLPNLPNTNSLFEIQAKVQDSNCNVTVNTCIFNFASKLN